MQFEEFKYFFSVWFFYRDQVSKWVRGLVKKRHGAFAQSTWLALALKPLWIKDQLRTWVGLPLVMALVSVAGWESFNWDNSIAQSWQVAEPMQNILTVELAMPGDRGEITYQLPVATMTGISQGFHPGHPGIDLQAPVGTEVRAMEQGVVVEVGETVFGYGKSVVIEHPLMIKTRYAHLNRIEVLVGEKLETGERLGEIGLTGTTTGPHLHFEVIESDKAENPLIYLYKAIEEYQTGLKK